MGSIPIAGTAAVAQLAERSDVAREVVDSKSTGRTECYYSSDMSIRDIINENADIRVRCAVRELEHRGFVLGVHFGVENAVSRLESMNRWMSWGMLGQFLQIYFWIPMDI